MYVQLRRSNTANMRTQNGHIIHYNMESAHTISLLTLITRFQVCLLSLSRPFTLSKLCLFRQN